MSALRTRKPTGLAPWPLVLLEGEEKAGKTYDAYALSASDKVDRTFVFDLGEGSADEYAALGRYEVVEHNGTYPDFVDQLEAAMAVPFEHAKPNVIIIDSMTALWSLLVDEAAETTKKRGKEDVTMDLWNKAKGKWRRVMDRLMTYGGIVVVTARGKEAVEVINGKPTSNRVWKVEAEKSLAYDVTAWVRKTRPRKAELVGVRSLVLQVPANRSLPLNNFDLEKFIFEDLGLTGQTAGTRDYKAPTAEAEVSRDDAAKALLDAVKGDKKLAAEVWKAAGVPEGGLSKVALDELVTTGEAALVKKTLEAGSETPETSEAGAA